MKQANIFSTEEGSIEQHIPGIGKPRKAPVAAIQAIVQAIERRVAVFSVLRKQRDIEQVNRLLHSAQHFVHHHDRQWSPGRILESQVWLCFAFT